MPVHSRLIPALAAASLALAGAPVGAVVPGFPGGPPADRPPPGTTEIGSMLDQVFFLKLGFSFMVGLAVGYALKVAFKIALIVIGLMLLGIFGLQYAGVAHVDWSGVEVHYNGLAGWLSANGGAFLDFIGNNLSNSVSFLAGLGLGLRL